MKNCWISDIFSIREQILNSENLFGYKIFSVKSLSPLIFEREGIEIGSDFEDTIYIHPLFISPLISENEELLEELQNFESSSAYQSPSFQAQIKGTIPDFLKNFYLFYKQWQSVFLLNVGDLVAVRELGANKYLILQKIIEHKGGLN